MNDGYYRFVSIMALEVLKKLSGEHEDFSRFELPEKPSRIIILGTLGDNSKSYSSTGDSERTLTTVKNNSLSIRFLVRSICNPIVVRLSLSLFYTICPTYEEEKEFLSKTYREIPDEVELARVWKRLDCSFEPINLDLSRGPVHELDFEPFMKIIENDREYLRSRKKIKSSSLKDRATYLLEIEDLHTETINLKWRGKILTDVRNFSQNDEVLKVVTITLLNDTKEDRYETYFFNCRLQIETKPMSLEPFKYEYEYDGAASEFENFTRCLNCQAIYNSTEDRVEAKPFAIFEQKRISPREEVNSITPEFERLASGECLPLLEMIYEEMNNYLRLYKTSKRRAGNNDFIRKTEIYEETTRRFQEGLEILRTSKAALDSFRFLNQTFRCASKFRGWRIFQLVFIVSLIPDIVNKSLKRHACEVLHVDTGAGKTEAYLGCVLFSAFFDRISGKESGCTAIAKFPLRMLSIQQFQRIAKLFCWAEEIRKKEIAKGEPFSLGYYVGSSDEFPRRSKPIIDGLQKSKRKKYEEIGKIIEKCPICNGKVILDYRNKERCIIHRCKKCEREYRLFYSDEEIYRFVPTFIISTVDKLAAVSLNRRFRNLVGGKLSECPDGHGFVPFNDKCEVQLENNEPCGKRGEPCKISYETGPTLIIQDELHLIRESFGTINCHFETLIENLEKEFCGFGPKYIAMTATVSGVRDQIMHLYHKETNIFPGESPFEKGKNDFFFESLQVRREGTTQRILIGLKPNLRDNQFASLLTLKYLSEFVKEVEKNLKEFSEEHDISIDDLREIVENYKIFLTYHNKKADVHSMNYYLEDVVNSQLPDCKIKPWILTGEATLEDIRGLIKELETPNKDSDNKRTLRAVFATSIISHGVDLEKLNIMVFQGMTRSTAEYIQALSRVGRKHPGVVFIWFYPNRARDLSYYQHFIDYNGILDRKVENAPLSRWTKLGFRQTFTSIFTASILNYISEIINEPVYTVDKVNEVFSQKKNRDKLVEFIKKAYVSDSKMEGSSYFESMIPVETEERLAMLANYTGGERNFFPNALKDCDNKYYKTQYGMRGIQDSVMLKPTSYTLNFLRKAEGE